LEVLRSTIVVPEALLKGLDNLRLLGNDATHIESKDYDDVGPEEVDAALAVTKEILRGVYQMHDIVGKLDALKRTQEDV
jgi:hypothetical protein